MRARGEVPAGRGREAVLPCGRLPPLCDIPVLGTRVAMMTTVTSSPGSGRRTRRGLAGGVTHDGHGTRFGSDVHHQGDDHGAAPVVLVDPPADDPPHDLAELAGVVDSPRRGPGHRLPAKGKHPAQPGRVAPPAPPPPPPPAP